MADDKAPIIVIKKKKIVHGGHHGGAWKVAYADFVTAMMAFFMVMWLMGSDEETKAAISDYFNGKGFEHPVELFTAPQAGGNQLNQFQQIEKPGGRAINLPAGQTNTAAARDPQLQDIHEELQQSISLELGVTSLADDIQLVYDSRGFVLRIAAKDFFTPGHSEVREDLRPVLHKIGQVLARHKRLIRIEGHTDSREPNGAYQNGWELSSARAAWVAQYWVSSFKIDPKQVQVAGNSHFRPIASSNEEWGRRDNRRVEVIVLNNKYREDSREPAAASQPDWAVPKAPDHPYWDAPAPVEAEVEQGLPADTYQD